MMTCHSDLLPSPPASDAPFVGVVDLARLLGRAPSWVHKNWKRRLVAELNFPAPVLTCPLAWDPVAIWAWRIKKLPTDTLAVLRRRSASSWEKALANRLDNI